MGPESGQPPTGAISWIKLPNLHWALSHPIISYPSHSFALDCQAPFALPYDFQNGAHDTLLLSALFLFMVPEGKEGQERNHSSRRYRVAAIRQENERNNDDLLIRQSLNPASG